MRILFSVPGPGIEPGWVAPPVFETGASTDSAIRAFDAAKLAIVCVSHNLSPVFLLFLYQILLVLCATPRFFVYLCVACPALE